MKSNIFKNLVVCFYFCAGALLFHILYFTSKRRIDDNIVDMDYETFPILIIIPFFIGTLTSFFYKKIAILNALYFAFFSFGCLAFRLTDTNTDFIISSIILSTTFILAMGFSLHLSFDAHDALSVKYDDTILDKNENYTEVKKKRPSFLRIYKIFSFAFISIGTGILILSTQTGGHISIDEGIGLGVLGLFLLGFAAFLWKLPKIGSWIVAVVCVIVFLLGEISIFEANIWSVIRSQKESYSVNFIRTLALMIFGMNVLLCAFIILSKTAREEWKMK